MIGRLLQSKCLGSTRLASQRPHYCGLYWRLWSLFPACAYWSLWIQDWNKVTHCSPFTLPFFLPFPFLSLSLCVFLHFLWNSYFFLPAWIMTLIQQWESNWSPTNASFSIYKALNGASVRNPFGKYHSYHTWSLDTPMGSIFSDSGLREPGEGAGLVSQGTNIICHVAPVLPKAIDDYF